MIQLIKTFFELHIICDLWERSGLTGACSDFLILPYTSTIVREEYLNTIKVEIAKKEAELILE